MSVGFTTGIILLCVLHLPDAPVAQSPFSKEPAKILFFHTVYDICRSEKLNLGVVQQKKFSLGHTSLSNLRENIRENNPFFH